MCIYFGVKCRIRAEIFKLNNKKYSGNYYKMEKVSNEDPNDLDEFKDCEDSGEEQKQ